MNGKPRRWGWVAALATALLVTACLPKGIRVPQSEFLAALERKSGLIAYVGTDGNVYIVDQSGNKPIQVTRDAHSDGDYLVYGVPAWSPDNQSLAFAGYAGRKDSPPDTAGLFVSKKDGSNLAQVYTSENNLVYYYWSPDSQRVSFLANIPGQNLALNIVSPSGGQAQTLDVGAPYYWTWAPDSHSLLVHVGDASTSTPAHLSLLQLNGGVTEQGLDIKPAMFKAPAFSPDGRKVLVASETAEGKSVLLLTDATGHALQTLAEYTGTIAFAWSPDGNRVGYIASEDSRLGPLGHLTIVDVSGKGTPVVVKDDLAYAFFWSPDSRSVAYFSPRLLPPPTSQPGSTPSAGSDASNGTQVVWSLRVLDAKGGDVRPIATFLPTDRFLQLLPYFDQYLQSATIWSPDSKNLVVSAYTRDGSPGIWVVAASGNLEPRYLADGVIGIWSWK